MNQILWEFNNIFGRLFSLIGLVGGICSFIGLIVKAKAKKKISGFLLLLIVSLGISSISWYVNRLVKIPDVTGLSYFDACNKLSDCDLRYNIETDASNLVVSEQLPSANTIVPTHTTIQLFTQNINQDANRIEEVRKHAIENNIPLTNVIITCQTDLLRWENDDQEVLWHFGEPIAQLESVDFHLKDIRHNVIYSDYFQNPDGSYCFPDIPSGGYQYELYAEFVGYDLMHPEMTLESSYVQDGQIPVTLTLRPTEPVVSHPYVVYIADHQGNTLPNLHYSIGIEDYEHFCSDSLTNEYGCAGIFFARPSQPLYLSIEYNEQSYKVRVELTGIKEGEALNEPVVILSEDGSYEITCAADFFNH